jgi:hypothetical protein
LDFGVLTVKNGREMCSLQVYNIEPYIRESNAFSKLT